MKKHHFIQDHHTVLPNYAYIGLQLIMRFHNMFACNGILFNHEFPRRGPTFVTRKITETLGQILKGETDRLVLGNIDSKRDKGYVIT